MSGQVVDAFEDEPADAARERPVVFVNARQVMREAALLLELSITDGAFELADGGMEPHVISMMRFCFKASAANDAFVRSF